MSKQDEPIEIEVLHDLLGLVGEDIPEQIIGSWAEQERAEVEKWAGASHLSASDNPVRVPPVPKVIDAHRRGKRPHLQLSKPVLVGKLKDRSSDK